MLIASSQISHIKRRRLPYDAKVQYLTSTSGSYINTGIYSAEITKVECRIRYNSFIGAYKPFFGAYRDEQYDSLRVISQGSSNNYVYVTANRRVNGSMSVALSIGAWHDVSIDCANNQCTVDGTTASSSTPHGTAFSAPLTIFGLNGVGGVSNISAGVMLASFVIFTSSGCVRSLEPVKFTNGSGVLEGALYDSVTRQLFRNAGTGSLVIGPDK